MAKVNLSEESSLISPADLPSASKLEKEYPRDDKPEITSVVTGKVVKKKAGIGKRFAETFLSDQIGNVGDYVVQDVVIPTIKGMIMDIVSGIGDTIADSLEMALFGTASGRRRRTRNGYGRKEIIDYGSISSYGGRRYGSTERRADPHTRASSSIDEIILESGDDAERVISDLVEIVDTYGFATVADLYSLVGWEPNHTDEKWGWTSYGGFSKSRVRDGYMLKVPRPKAID